MVDGASWYTWDSQQALTSGSGCACMGTGVVPPAQDLLLRSRLVTVTIAAYRYSTDRLAKSVSLEPKSLPERLLGVLCKLHDILLVSLTLKLDLISPHSYQPIP